MSRTYKNNIRAGIAYGCNTEFYRNRIKKQRRVNNRELYNKIGRNIDLGDIEKHGMPEEIVEQSDSLSFINLPKKDTWREPSDGYVLITPAVLERDLNDLRTNVKWQEFPEWHSIRYKYLIKYKRVLKKIDKRSKNKKFQKVM